MDSSIVQRLTEVALEMQDELRPDVVTLRELSHRMQMHERTVANKVKRGEIPLAPQPWSRYRMLFLRRDVDRLLGATRRMGRSASAA